MEFHYSQNLTIQAQNLSFFLYIIVIDNIVPVIARWFLI